MKRILLGMLLAFPSMMSAQYTGKVFIDTNHNGSWDKGETLMKGVSVSDGLNVVQTDSKGCFTLPGHDKERFIFITTPSGYKTENAYYRRIEGNVPAGRLGRASQPGRGQVPAGRLGKNCFY